MRLAVTALISFALTSLTQARVDKQTLSFIQGNSNHEWSLFGHFVEDFERVYDTFEEFSERFQIFRDNLKFIVKHNGEQNNSTLGLSRFSDMTHDEYQHFVSQSGYSNNKWKLRCSSYNGDGRDVEREIDWREQGVVNEPRDQGNAGTCWAFSTTTSVESAHAIKTGNLYDLAEQQLVDCDTRSSGTNGGMMEWGMIYLIGNGGQCLEDSYPYTASDTTCHDCKTVVSLSDCYGIEEGNERAMMEILNQHPISVSIDASSREFQHYNSGVITSDSCYKQLNHGVAAVGYGEDNGQKYWIVKNSWGTGYGQDGYVLIGRSDTSNSRNSVCGIAMDSSYPEV
jgi:C1A family cysteine protease